MRAAFILTAAFSAAVHAVPSEAGVNSPARDWVNGPYFPDFGRGKLPPWGPMPPDGPACGYSKPCNEWPCNKDEDCIKWKKAKECITKTITKSYTATTTVRRTVTTTTTTTDKTRYTICPKPHPEWCPPCPKGETCKPCPKPEKGRKECKNDGHGRKDDDHSKHPPVPWKDWKHDEPERKKEWECKHDDKDCDEPERKKEWECKDDDEDCDDDYDSDEEDEDCDDDDDDDDDEDCEEGEWDPRHPEKYRDCRNRCWKDGHCDVKEKSSEDPVGWKITHPKPKDCHCSPKKPCDGCEKPKLKARDEEAALVEKRCEACDSAASDEHEEAHTCSCDDDEEDDDEEEVPATTTHPAPATAPSQPAVVTHSSGSRDYVSVFVLGFAALMAVGLF